MLILGVLNGVSGSESARAHLRDVRERIREAIQSRFERAVRAGELPPAFNSRQGASFFLGVTQMISLQARDGATRPDLEALIPPAVQAMRAMCML